LSPKNLIALGIVWLGAVALWRHFGPRSFGHAWQARGTMKRTMLIAAIYTLGFLHHVFIFGWLVPTGLGLFRLAQKN
jgi:hypothetical protein